MTMPLMPQNKNYIKSAPTYSYRGQLVNSGDGFPTGRITLSTVPGKIVIVACQLAGGPAASNVTVGGTATGFNFGNNNQNFIQTGVTGAVPCIQACAIASNGQSSIWYAATNLSGSQFIWGGGGSGRSILHVYEMYGYSSGTPYAVNTGAASGLVLSVGLPTSTNTITFGAGMMGPTGVTLGRSDGPPLASIINVAFESATTHYSFVQTPTPRGNPTTVYTASGNGSVTYGMAVAAWR